MSISKIQQDTKNMIDSLKTICANYGLGNASSEYKIITEVFLYKYLNDKFLYKAKQVLSTIPSEDVETHLKSMSKNDYELFLDANFGEEATFTPDNLLTTLWNKQNEDNFHQTFDKALLSLSDSNKDVFSVNAGGGAKMALFDSISQYIIGNKKDDFCRAIVDKLATFSFESVFALKYDFFATIFEYLIKDYNKDSGKYAEYYTPHTVSQIIAKILVPKKDVKSVSIYDPSAGSGTLLLSLAHEIGEDKCSVYSQDISQKSSEFLRLNLILNNLVHSLHNVIQGDTLINPSHVKNNSLRKFDYIVSNPPFNVDFSDFREELAGEHHRQRFFAGVPTIPNKKKDSMSIYLMFIQHIIYSLSEKGKAAIVVPTGFLTAGSGIPLKIREHIIAQKMLRGVVSMPSNIFATTGTNVSILFLDKKNTEQKAIFIDASKLGESKKDDGNNQKTVLSTEDIEKIITIFNTQASIDDFSVYVEYQDIIDKKYSFSAGQYFDVKIEYSDLTEKEFQSQMNIYRDNLSQYFVEGEKLQKDILEQLGKVKYEG